MEEIKQILVRGLWDRSQGVGYRIDCFTKLCETFRSMNFALKFYTRDLERFIEENDCNEYLIIRILGFTFFIHHDTEDTTEEEARNIYSTIAIAYADAHPMAKDEIMLMFGGSCEDSSDDQGE